jgi:hypothetical protein
MCPSQEGWGPTIRPGDLIFFQAKVFQPDQQSPVMTMNHGADDIFHLTRDGKPFWGLTRVLMTMRHAEQCTVYLAPFTAFGTPGPDEQARLLALGYE